MGTNQFDPYPEGFVKNVVCNKEFELELKRNIYRRSYYEFFKAFFPHISRGDHYNDNWHIKLICDRLQQEVERIKQRRARSRDIIINVPFRSTKSLMVSAAFPAWTWLESPSMKFINTSYSASLALEHAELNRILIRSHEYQELFGNDVEFIEDENQKGFFTIKGGGYRKSVGTGGQITGSGGDIIIIDDPQNPKMSTSEVERENVKTFYDTTLYSRLNQPELGVRIIIMQRLHEEDLTGYLLAKAPHKYEHICIPVEVDMKNLAEENISPSQLIKYYSKDGLFWPSRFSKRVISDFTEALGSVEAAGQLYQRPSPKEGNLVKAEWFEIVNPTTITRDLRYDAIHFYVDTAETEKTTGDFSAICAAFVKNGTVYICNVVKVKKSFVELNKFIVEWCNANMYNKYSMIKIEPKSSGKSVCSQMKATTGMNVVEMESPKDDKLTRFASITPLCESGRVKFLQGNYVKPTMQSLMTFPNGKNDDDVDVVVYAVRDLLATNNFDFAFVG